VAAFTDKFISGLKPAAKLYEERDAGCPGLLIRVGQRGQKVWEVIISRDGNRRRVRIGTYPDVSLAMARRLASEKKSAPTVHSQGLRVRDLWVMYKAEMMPKRRAFHSVENVWSKWAEPVIGNVRLDDLNMRHGAELIGEVVKHSTPDRARKVVRYLSPMLSFAAGRGLIPGNPWAGLHLPEGVAARDRVLSRAEWLALWQWGQGAPYPWGALLMALMLSAQRLNEVAGMRWDEIDGDVWAIPAARHKSKRRHEVPLSGALVALIAAQPRHEDHVFSVRSGRPTAPGSTLKNRIKVATGVTDWRFHDLRRTGATLMAEGGVNRFILERVLGHADSSVTGIYDRATYREEKRQALEVLAATVRAGDG
jgi:integrase